MTVLKKLLDAVEAVLKVVTLGFYVAVVVVVVFQVLNRFWLHLPIVWTSDLAIICFIWLGFLTAARAVRNHGHFRMALTLDLVGDGLVRRLLELLAIGVGLALFGLLTVKGYDMAVRGLREVSPGLQVPMIWAYLALPVSAALALLFYAEKLLDELSGRAREQRARQSIEDEEAI
ncbi:MAG: TRAP transporter small permease [Tistlia sp.]|uniref:TRAP transporter small permease n=1 Tax=Tistlia sp. TaxID=3057121 RepID=UPI0034A31ADE